MIKFFKAQASIIATDFNHQPTDAELQALEWLCEAKRLSEDTLTGFFVGPRREMITPWSTNAVEITQNMALSGIRRIEEFFPVESADAEHDTMLQRMYDGLGQDIFTIDIKPQPIRHIDDLNAYNEQEGLALSKEEIDYLLKVQEQLRRPLTDSEVFGFAQINSEHCRHKIFGGVFIIDGKEMPSSLFAMIKKTTKENPHKILSAYKDNVAFSEGPVVEQFAPEDQTTSSFFQVKEVQSVISLKAETHNFPTTVEPFNGAATGTGGEIRDRMGGGTGSWPIAGTAVYMTAYPRKESTDNAWEKILPVRQWLYQTPEQILIKASNGASDFGNKFGQPLITGSLLTFEHQEGDEKYAYDKVIMLAGGVGYGTKRDCLKKDPQKGNKIVVVGGDNYRIGLGGGSVSSVNTGRYSNGIELNAVQRANPEMQKRAYNLVRALCEDEENPVVSIHDHGSAGHVNCLSELVEECGGEIDMTALPIGDTTLSSKEIIANESQERMGLLIDEKHIDRVRKIAERERAPLYVVGETTGDAHFSFRQADGVKPFDLDVAQMFGHSPVTYMRDETVSRTYRNPELNNNNLESYIKNVLRLEAVACKDWLTNKVDRSVTGKIARQQCQGEIQLPLSDCGVVALDYRGKAGIATAIGHAPQAGLASPEAGSVLSVAEALTNIVFAPLADGLDSVSLSANWMWPCRSQKGEDARLYSAVKALSDFCCEIGVNVPTGKDSLSMTQQYPDGQKIIAPGTVIVSSGAEVSNIRGVVSPVIVNEPDTMLFHIDFSYDEHRLGGSALAQSLGYVGSDVPTVKNPTYFADAFDAVQELVQKGILLAGHDISAGGLITTLLEMTFANKRGSLNINIEGITGGDYIKTLFAENPGVVVQIKAADKQRFFDILEEYEVQCAYIGTTEGATLSLQTVEYKTFADEKEAPRTLRIFNGDTEIIALDINEMRSIWYETSHLLDRKQSFNGQADERAKNYAYQPLEFSLVQSASAQPNSASKREQSSLLELPSGSRVGEANSALCTLHSALPPSAAIIREKGTNGEREMAYALHLAGFRVKDVMMTDLITGRETLDDVQMIVFCGGFSNSDVLGSAKGWAGAFLYNPKAKEALDRFYAREDTLSLGICNGCQLMVELQLVGAKSAEPGVRTAKMLHNKSHKFESSFVTLRISNETNAVMLQPLKGCKLGVWVAHGEGRFSLTEKADAYDIAAQYNYSLYPGNPNGSDYAAAAICSADGRHLAMMPHPERAIFPWQCAHYPRDRRFDDATPWLDAFIAAREWCELNRITQRQGFILTADFAD